tara:strand:+ start:25785 stop:26231 length:447 start_codon:yes stop_codon:yes gene_type:complete
MKQKFSEIRGQLEEHLLSINENTSEIQVLFDYLQDMETKIEKLNSRLDQLQMDAPLDKPKISPLTALEKKVFLVLYTEDTPISFEEIAERSGLKITLARECVSAIIGKGIPIQRSYVNNQLFIKIDHEFKEVQAKENIINLSLKNFIQ